MLSEYPPGANMLIDGYAYGVTWLVVFVVAVLGLVAVGLCSCVRARWAKRVFLWLGALASVSVFVGVCTLVVLAEYVR